jgi:hypothetical protein
MQLMIFINELGEDLLLGEEAMDLIEDGQSDNLTSYL